MNNLFILGILFFIFYMFCYNKQETLDNTPKKPLYSTPSCGLANSNNNCFTCEDVDKAHAKVGRIYNPLHFEQCS